MSVFLLIGKTSALTMNVAGVIKDWLLIGLSVLLFHAEVGVAEPQAPECTAAVKSCACCKQCAVTWDGGMVMTAVS